MDEDKGPQSCKLYGEVPKQRNGTSCIKLMKTIAASRRHLLDEEDDQHNSGVSPCLMRTWREQRLPMKTMDGSVFCQREEDDDQCEAVSDEDDDQGEAVFCQPDEDDDRRMSSF